MPNQPIDLQVTKVNGFPGKTVTRLHTFHSQNSLELSKCLGQQNEFPVPETFELLSCTNGIRVPQTILKLRKGMGSPVSIDPENCTSNNYYTQ